MGNKNCKNCTTWNSLLFPENEEEERLQQWIRNSNSLAREYEPSFPSGTEVLPVQPVYNPDVQEFQFSQGNEKPSRRKRNYLFSEKDLYSKSRSRDKESQNGQEWAKENDGKVNISRTEQDLKIKKYDTEEASYQKQNTRRRFPTGRVYISLSHDPITRRIKVAIVKAKNLSCKQTGLKDKCGINCPASYMNISLYEGERVCQSYSTAVKKGYSEVLYYERFAFDTSSLNLSALSVQIIAKHTNKHRFINQIHEIGKVILQGQMNDDMMIDSHLVEAIQHPGNTTYKWHTLWS